MVEPITIKWFNVDDLELSTPETIELDKDLIVACDTIDDEVIFILKMYTDCPELGKGQRCRVSELSFDLLFSFTYSGDTYRVSKLDFNDFRLYKIESVFDDTKNYIIFTPNNEIYVFEELGLTMLISAGGVTKIALDIGERISWVDSYFLDLKHKTYER